MIIIKKIKIKMDFYLCEYTNNRNFVDWLTYRQLNHLYYHYWSTIVYPNWCKYVQYQLSKITNLDNIFKTNHSLFGSFLLKCIYQVPDIRDSPLADIEDPSLTDRWNKDVDLLVNSDVTYELFTEPDNEFKTLTKNIYNNNYKIKTELIKDQLGQFGVRTFQHSNYVDIDHVIILNGKTHSEFVSNFDFDFCKVCFDGKKLFISNIDAIINKHTVVNTDTLKNSFNMAEYGFRCDPCVRRAKYVLDKLIERMEKYTIRGFTFDIDLNGVSDLTELCWQTAKLMDKGTQWEDNLNYRCTKMAI